MIMSLVINSLAWGRIHTHMHTNTHVHTETILRNQTCASPWDRVLQRMHSELDKCLKGLERFWLKITLYCSMYIHLTPQLVQWS